jgi:hypothetical protein
VPTAVDWAAWPAALAAGKGLAEAELARWEQEYADNVQPEPDPWPAPGWSQEKVVWPDADGWADYPYDFGLEELTDGLAEPDLYPPPAGGGPRS